MNGKRICIFILLLLPLAAVLTQCLPPDKEKPDPRDQVFAGSHKCINCHKDIYNNYVHTAHYMSTAPATAQSINGDFLPGNNTFRFNKQLQVVMEKRDSGFYQAAYFNGKLQQAHRFDIVFGRTKAQTYLSWRGNRLFQLPVSYFNNVHRWTNSPGYATDHAEFDRPITRRCFECHSSYIKELPKTAEDMQRREVDFDKESLINGIDCERCHGPAANHVNYHTQFPQEKQAKYIVKFAALTRSQKMDACGVCHSGGKDVFQVTAFRFKMGDKLENFKEPNFLKQDLNPATLDVHGNQDGLLRTSQCFLKSNMDCSSCHDAHKNDIGNTLVYSQRCMACHKDVQHKFNGRLVNEGILGKNCIDCHMPQKPSNVIAVEASGGKKVVPYMVRTHHIAVYPQETDKVIAYLSKQYKQGN
ncbi:multiheme c-type cytochrome [Mucilaginibacter ginkgonis]|uniref:Cytochrome c-552/4 domain-containing protein n=1 Tax=Mucilaginibacter ginkgonis TaxID=2682091 RepID=A0A6I4I3N7_9SPHI|nr:multiheme c-type cytochrome [Mucilaginibacter ginkgonis]QQL50473.1 hypothetical protein GO620_003180 [Mucilaginibacter ginkgonis]